MNPFGGILEAACLSVCVSICVQNTSVKMLGGGGIKSHSVTVLVSTNFKVTSANALNFDQSVTLSQTTNFGLL